MKYLILFANLRDNLQIRYLGRQIFPGKGEAFVEAFSNAVKSDKWGYLVVDLHNYTPDELRLRSKIFPDDDAIIVYSPNKV